VSADLFTVTLEEHFSIEPLLAALEDAPGPSTPEAARALRPLLLDLGDRRFAAMEEGGVDVQVISSSSPGFEQLSGADVVALAREVNDTLLDAVRQHPGRFAGFATLPVSDPPAAADELRRSVGLGMRGALLNGAVDGRFLDDRSFEPLLSAAEELAVPLYLHPGVPAAAVRAAYYEGFSDAVERRLAGPAWGWHADTAVHVLRLAVSGTLDRHPRLKLIIGHMGEMLPVMLERANAALATDLRLERPIAQALRDQLHLTTSGIFSHAAFHAAVEAFGIERLMFSIDYPFGPSAPAAAFLRALNISDEHRRMLAGENAARLLGIERPFERAEGG
jgi:predicted TIM-barrel fold metal-dependent hydrolase